MDRLPFSEEITITPLIQSTTSGLYCEAGDFYVDPWRPVDRAVITHAHSDHARAGSRHYLVARRGEGILRRRIGSAGTIESIEFGEAKLINGVRVSLHPAGHLLGSAQVRVEHAGETWVMTGDYKIDEDQTCFAWEPVPCDVFITECTFGLPVYRWPSHASVFDSINRWWAANREDGRTSVIFAYALGKAQRVLSGLDAQIGPILVHGAVDQLLPAYRAEGVSLPPTIYASPEASKAHKGSALVIAPPSAAGSPWLRKFGACATAFASGWMHVRGPRRRRNVDRGFVLSDHVDWDGLHRAIDATGAKRIGLMHGYVKPMQRWLASKGFEVSVFDTRFQGELDADDVEDATVERKEP